MKIYQNPRIGQGFSLLEVLVAVVILSFGLLALAALQLGLIRSSSETKAQTTAMALTKERIESLENYQSLGGSDSTCISPYAGTVNTCYRAITGPVTEPAISLGGVTFVRSFTVARYVYDKATGTFVARANTALDSAIKAASATALPGKEFKRVVVSTAWTDATGSSNQVQVEDAISAISPGDSLSVTKTAVGNTPRPAVAIITNPSSVAGVIPIAIGNGSDTAATNPRPVIVSQGNNSTAVETRFDIYTYAALNSTTAQAQSRVETAVVGCKCSLGTGTQTAFRPTYWNGKKYVTPGTAAMPTSTAVTSGVTQSDLCTACCRDHQDPAGVTGEKYDARRAVHNHYAASNLLTPVVAGNYDEACRAIRVDGIFRIAAEPYDDQFGLLATAGLNASTPTTTVTNAVPSTGTTSVTTDYQNFVINYLASRFVTGTAYNTVTDPTTITGYSALQLPAKAYIATASSPQYLHARGLFIDYLSTEAITAITKAKDDCVTNSCTTAQLQTAVLKLLPFTSINLSELAAWSSSAAAKVDVSDFGFKTTINDPLPVKGKAETKNGAITGDQVNGIGTIQRSSAGLAVTSKVFPDSELTNNVLTDLQLFEVGAGQVGNPSGEQFTVALSSNALLSVLTLANPAEVVFDFLSTTQSCNKNASTITPYTCTPASGTLAGSIPVKVGNYNRAYSTTDGKSVANSCTNANNDTTRMPYRVTFDVSSASVSPSGSAIPQASVQDGAVGSIANGGEYTIVDVNPLVNGSAVTVNFSNAVYLCPSNWSSLMTSAGTEVSGAGSNCDNGNGSNQNPIWSSTYVTCPGTPLQ